MRHMIKKASIVLGLTALAGTAPAQLVVGNDNSTDGNLWVLDLANAANNRRLLSAPSTDAQPWGIAVDPDSNTIWWLDNGNRLLRANMTSTGTLTPVFVGTTTVGGTTSTFTGLAYDTVTDQLIGYRSVTAPGFYEINQADATATLVVATTGGDYGGFDYDIATDAFYAANDATTGGGRGIVRISKPLASATFTNIALYPGTDTDIDGLAAGGGKLYLVNDTAAQGVFVYNLGTNSYEANVTLPFTGTAGTFSAGAWAPALVVPPVGADVSVSLTDVADCAVGSGQALSFTATVGNLAGTDPANNVVLTITLPAGTTFVSSVPANTPVGDTLTFNLGTLSQGQSTPVTVNLTAGAAGVITYSANAATSSSDPNSGNNSASQSTQIAGSAPTTAAAVGLFTTLTSASTSSVPGLTGAQFGSGITPGGIRYSADRSNWVMAWDTTLGTGLDQIMLGVVNGTAVVFSQEETFPDLGTAQGADPSIPPFFPFGSYDAMYGVNNAGTAAYSGLDNRSGAAEDGYIVKSTVTASPTATLVVQEALTPVPGLSGAFFGSTRNSVGISTSGVTSFQHNMIGTAGGTATDVALFANDGNTIVAQEGVTIPTNQANGGSAAYSAFTTGSVSLSFQMDATQTNWISNATLGAPTPTTSDAVVVVNNDVKVQEGFPLPGSTFGSNVSTIRAVRMEPESTWFASGSNSDGTDWVVRNGTLIAERGAPIFTGASENWSDTGFASGFFLHAGNPDGDYVVGGVTDSSNGLANAAVVLNGTTVVARENDPIDLDGDGTFDDDAYIRTFIDDRLMLTNTDLFLVVRLRNGAVACGGADTDIGQAVIRIPLPGGGSACDSVDFNNDGVFPDDQDLADFIFVLGGGDCPTCNDVDFNNDGVFPDDSDLATFLFVLGGGTC